MKLKCNKCNIEVVRTLSQFKKSKTGNVYCSRSCANGTNNSLFRLWENNPNFINGNTTYRQYKLKFSNKCCEICNISDVRVLQVHHIDKNRKNNKLENLMLLCANCHLITHYEEIT